MTIVPDLLTHVLVLYVATTVVSWRYPWLRPYVPVAMAGAVIPDLAKVRLLVGASTAEATLGAPFSWYPIHRLGGAVVIAGFAALCFSRRTRLRALGVLLAGVASAFLLDAGLIRASGMAPPYLYPLTWWQPPTAGIYLSSDRWPAVVAVGAAVIVWLLDNISPFGD